MMYFNGEQDVSSLLSLFNLEGQDDSMISMISTAARRMKENIWIIASLLEERTPEEISEFMDFPIEVVNDIANKRMEILGIKTPVR